MLNGVTEKIRAKRGKCPSCGRDFALTPSGLIWGHANWEGPGDCPGARRPPMTTEESTAWDEEQATRRAERQRRTDAEALDWVTREGFRKFDEGSLRACPWQSQLVAFIVFNEVGPLTFANRVTQKRALLRSDYGLLVAWPGQYSQHIFRLAGEDKDVARHAWLGE
jgi:hypothetical protein